METKQASITIEKFKTFIEKKEPLYIRIYEWIDHNIIHNISWYFKEKYRSIKSVITWLPVIWRDRFWDYNYLYLILKKKIDLMEQGHRTESHALHGNKTARKLKLCSLLLDRMIKDNYYELAREPDKVEYSTNDIEDWVKRINSRTELDRKMDRWYMEKENNLRKQDLKILFTKLEKHMYEFWD